MTDTLSDIAPFCDVGTVPEVVTHTETELVCRIVRAGTELELRVQQERGVTYVQTNQGPRTPFAQFLVSRGMADLAGLFRAQERSFARHNLGRWVSGDGELSDGRPVDALSFLSDRSSPPTLPAATRLLVVDGPAGIGKTQLLRKLCAGIPNAIPCLLVTSQGRRLSRLNDAIAATLNSLKCSLSVDEFVVLARHRCLGLVVDGFDELVNQEGYEDAWASLSDFLEQLQGRGLLIVSARDTFFDANEFFKRAGIADQLRDDLEVQHIRLRPWRPKHVDAFLATSPLEPARREIVKEWVDSDNLGLLSRPYFVRELELHFADESLDTTGTVTQIVIDSFVAREAKILTSIPAELSAMRRILRLFFEDVAGEMLTQGSEIIAVEALQFWLEAHLEDAKVDAVRAKAYVHRASSVALLEAVGGSRRERSFPHEYVFHYFASAKLGRALRERPADLPHLLAGGPFSLDLADAMVEFAESHGATQQDAHTVLSLMDGAGYNQPVYGNLGGLLFAILRSLPFPDSMEFTMSVEGHQFGSVSLAGFFPGPFTLRDCSFEFLDITDLYGFDIVFENTHVLRLRVDENTRIGDSRPTVQSIEVYEDGALVRTHNPEEIKRALDSAALVEQHPVDYSAPGAVLLARLAYRWLRHYWLDPSDPQAETDFYNPLWPQLREILERHGRLREKIPDASGPRKGLIHLKDARSILDGWHIDPEQEVDVLQIWQEAARLS